MIVSIAKHGVILIRTIIEVIVIEGKILFAFMTLLLFFDICLKSCEEMRVPTIKHDLYHL